MSLSNPQKILLQKIRYNGYLCDEKLGASRSAMKALERKGIVKMLVGEHGHRYWIEIEIEIEQDSTTTNIVNKRGSDE